MIKKIHDHILEELKTNTKTDIIFVLTAIVLNFIVLGINSGLAASGSNSNLIIMYIFITLVVLVNFVVEIALIKAMQSRVKLISGLVKMYKDNNVEKYYDTSLLNSYKITYMLFMLAVLFLGIVAVIVPFFVK